MPAAKGRGAQGLPVAPRPPRVSAKGRRQKGNRAELEFAKLVGGKRVFASGKFGHIHEDLREDVTMPDGQRVQCKTLANGWATLYRWLETADYAALRANGKRWLVVMDVEHFLALRPKPEEVP